MWALFEIVTPRSFTLVTACIGLLLIVTALKEYADLEKLTCNSLHLVSFNWNLFVSACLTSLSTASYFHLVDSCDRVGHRLLIDVLPKIDLMQWHWCHLSWPGRARASIWSPAVHLPWLIPNPSSNHGRTSLVASCQWETPHSSPTPKVGVHNRKLGHKNGMVNKIECFPKVEKHHVHCRTLTVYSAPDGFVVVPFFSLNLAMVWSRYYLVF